MLRKIAGHELYPMGLGCMNLSHGYGAESSFEDAKALLLKALDLGVDFFDTATLYGFGKNETLVGEILKPYRQKIFLASKCGMAGVDGKRVIDGRPETLAQQIDASLKRLQTDVIDLYYLHRWDKSIPIEDSVGAMARMVEQGKVRYIGLSEVSGASIKKANAVHPIAAVQNEYSLWSRNAELGALQACKDINATLVAFSPVARAFLTNTLLDTRHLIEGDIRLTMPRFNAENYPKNLALLPAFAKLAEQANCTPAQLSLAWLLAQDETLIPIPGTANINHLVDNHEAARLVVSNDILEAAGKLINQSTVHGERYGAQGLREVDTESFSL